MPTRSPAVRTAVPAKLKPSREQLASSARWALIISTLVTLAIFVTPGLQIVGIPLLYLSTMVHEMGHGVGSLLAGGEWIEFRLFSDGSGYALSQREAGFSSALSAAAGLVGPALAAAVFMALGLRARLARFGLGAAGLFFAFTLVFYVRGTFGFVFVTAVAAACLFIAIRASDETARIALLFFATQLALSVYSRGDYLFEDYVSGQMTGGKPSASDTQHMADAVGMPYWFWGLVCAAFSAAVLAVSAWLYIREPRRRAPAAP